MLPKYTGAEILKTLATDIINGKADESCLSAFCSQVEARLQEKGLKKVIPIIARVFILLADPCNGIWPHIGTAFLVVQLGEDGTRNFLKKNFSNYYLKTLMRDKKPCFVIATQAGITSLLQEFAEEKIEEMFFNLLSEKDAIAKAARYGYSLN